MKTGSLAAFVCGFALVGVCRPSLAQTTLDAERFKPAVTEGAFVNAEGTTMRPRADPWALGLVANYSRNTLVTVDGNGNLAQRFISGRLGFDALVSVTLAKPFSLGLDLPFFLAQTGDASPSFAGLGDLRLVPKLRFIGGVDGFGLGLVAELRLPTHTGDYAGGARNVVFAPRLLADYRARGGLRLGMNVGALLRETTTFYNVVAGSEFTYAIAAGYRFGGWNGKLELGAEANGAVGLLAARVEETPLEVFPYGKVRPNDQWEIMFGPGIGVVPGYGVPILRAFVGLRYTPTFNDPDHDGFSGSDDMCPDQPETRNGFEDNDGCPDEEPDDDHDGVPNSQDQCPNEKETINGIQDDDGCPDGGPAMVIRQGGEIRILENVRFHSGSTVIEPQSYSVLNQVALTLKANPDIKRLRVEGHTDAQGSKEVNRQLSRARAQAVREYLIGRGIRPARLTVAGFGSDKPLVREDNDAGRSVNRRVEFHVD